MIILLLHKGPNGQKDAEAIVNLVVPQWSMKFVQLEWRKKCKLE